MREQSDNERFPLVFFFRCSFRTGLLLFEVFSVPSCWLFVSHFLFRGDFYPFPPPVADHEASCPNVSRYSVGDI